MLVIFLGGVRVRGSGFSCGGGAIMISSDTSVTIGERARIREVFVISVPPPPLPSSEGKAGVSFAPQSTLSLVFFCHSYIPYTRLQHFYKRVQFDNE